jgi:hypothetical protein
MSLFGEFKQEFLSAKLRGVGEYWHSSEIMAYLKENGWNSQGTFERNRVYY